MGACQSQESGLGVFEKEEESSLNHATVKTPMQTQKGRILECSKRSSHATPVFSPSEQTHATALVTPFSFASPENVGLFSAPRPQIETSIADDYGDFHADREGPSFKHLETLCSRSSASEVMNVAHSEKKVYPDGPPRIAPQDVPNAGVRPRDLSTSSVDPQTLASFDRLKIQVLQAEQSALQNRRKLKLEQRIEDVQGYRNLWKEFESMKKQVDATSSGGEFLEKTNTASLNLYEPGSWYFDFKHIQNLQQSDGGKDDTTVLSSRIVAEETLAAQRKYFEDKSQERMGKRKELQLRIGDVDEAKTFQDDKLDFSGRSKASHGSIAQQRANRTEVRNRDHGLPVVRQGSFPQMELSYRCSEVASPHIYPGRNQTEEARRPVLHDDGTFFISDREIDNDDQQIVCGSDRKDTISSTDRSTEGASKPFQVPCFDFKVREDSKGHETGAAAPETSGEDQTRAQSNSLGLSKAVLASADCSTPKSQIQQYGVDLLVPLSSQLEFLAREVPSLQIANAQSGEVHWRAVPFTDGKTSATARRLEDIFEEDDLKSRKTIEWEPRPVTKPVIGGSGIRRRMLNRGWNENSSPNTPVTAAHQKASRFTPDGQNTLNTQSPIDNMSPSQFLMMSSFVYSVDYDLAANNQLSLEAVEKPRIEDSPVISTYDSELHPPPSPSLTLNEEGQQRDSANLLADNDISSIPTEVFLLMSSKF
jgi:hypothetical protein